ncbi:unnamed protein product [Ectocarpus sp. CCAP 1310/34]|nr:unnamed protein product [Ectocarpus sp. CCAP 1310/34]
MKRPAGAPRTDAALSGVTSRPPPAARQQDSSSNFPIADAAAAADGGGMLVEIQFAGPQPSEGCGALLCNLLRGSSVEARAVELPRGRKKKIATSVTPENGNNDIFEGGVHTHEREHENKAT